MADDDLDRAITAYTDAYQALEALVRGAKPVPATRFTELWEQFKVAEKKYDDACRERGWTPPYRGD